MPRLAVYTLLLLLAAPPAAGRSELERLERRHRQWQRGDSGTAHDDNASGDSHEQQAGRRWQAGRRRQTGSRTWNWRSLPFVRASGWGRDSTNAQCASVPPATAV